MFGTFDLGIDLGTANVLVYDKNKGIIINEPSVVAMDTKSSSIVAVGSEAKEMVGRTPGHITAIRPMKDGVIADYDTTAAMMKYFIRKAIGKGNLFRKPRVVVCAPTGVTGVEKRAIFEAALQAGGKEVYIIEESFAAAIGAGLPVSEPVGSMIVDIGGGTTEVAILSLGGIVTSHSLRTGGDKMDDAIIQYIRKKHSLMIGDRTAENLKIELGCAIKQEHPPETSIRGRDLITGLPKVITINANEVLEALSEIIDSVTDAVKNTLETCPPELSGDIIERGIVLTGGGSLLRDLDTLLSSELDIPVLVAECALDCVAIGTGRSLENISFLTKLS